MSSTIDQLRAHYERSKLTLDYRHVNAASYDELYEMFANDCLSLSEIGRQIGVTRERARQIYNKYFRAALPVHKTGWQRIKTCTLKRIAVAKSTARAGRLAGTVQDYAESLELVCKPIFHKDDKNRWRQATTSNGSLYINGHLCKVRQRGNVQFTGPKSITGYFNFHHIDKSCKDVEFLILVIHHEGLRKYFVIPAKALPPTLTTLYIREVPRKYDGHERGLDPEFDAWNYLERWDLLEDPNAHY